ncbi:MAG: hypothetical protein J0H19_05390 [Rhodospirillales bacterium]|nr:hypothetical protein [Rhodospirillales bacterium]
MGTIDGVGGTGPARAGWARPSQSGGQGGAGFAVPASAPSPSSAGAAPLPLGGVLETMLALQAVATPEERNRTALRRGQALLGELSRLQAALLRGGEGAEAARAALGSLAAPIEEPADPVLASLLRSIRLRAQVELERLRQ